MYGPAVLAGLALAFFAARDYQSEAAFVLDQQAPRIVEAPAVESVLRAAPEPRPEGRQGKPPREVRCTPGSERDPQRNPWRCRTKYESGLIILYIVQIKPNGQFEAASRDGVRRIEGTIAVP